MASLFDRAQEALDFIKSRAKRTPQVGIILGTGLGQLADHFEETERIPYKEIPFFPRSTVTSHKGELVLGKLNGVEIIAMAGRFHYYEGYSMEEVTFPVRVLKLLGIQTLVISNAAGSANAHIEAGDLVFIKDHINFMPENPLRGPNDERFGPRFPDMLNTYNRSWNQEALKFSASHNIRAHEGVYFGLQGPNLETPAEYQFINRIGADVVGMSTIPEVLVARHMNLPVFVVSVATNKCFPPNTIQETTVEDVIAVAQKAEVKLEKVIRFLLPHFI